MPVQKIQPDRRILLLTRSKGISFNAWTVCTAQTDRMKYEKTINIELGIGSEREILQHRYPHAAERPLCRRRHACGILKVMETDEKTMCIVNVD